MRLSSMGVILSLDRTNLIKAPTNAKQGRSLPGRRWSGTRAPHNGGKVVHSAFSFWASRSNRVTIISANGSDILLH